MRYFLILALSIYSIGALSQGIGESMNVNAVKVNDSIYISDNSKGIVVYITDKKNVINTIVVYPSTKISEDRLIEKLNTECTVISATKWKTGGYYITKVRESNLRDHYFVYSASPQLKRSYEKY